MFHVVRLDWVNLADQGLPGSPRRPKVLSYLDHLTPHYVMGNNRLPVFPKKIDTPCLNGSVFEAFMFS